jgi:hypothetical protein
MRDLWGIGIIVGAVWWIISSYIKKWKSDNPGKPVFEWVELKDGAGDSYSKSSSSMYTSDPSADSSTDKWLSPGGITTEYYSYYSQADEDSRRSHE